MLIQKYIIGALLILYSQLLMAQHTSSIRGRVLDSDSESPIPFATIILVNSNPQMGTYSDEEGNFIIENVPVGRYDLHVEVIGYEAKDVNGLSVISGKTQFLNIRIKETVTSLDEIKISIAKDKSKPQNSMATVSGHQLSMEEANKFAGGFDDPARLVSSYAGVAPAGLTNNGIVIRGNAPKGLLWRMEGVEIPNPNHFGEIAGFGAGGITALSSQMMANSDFFTGAFPAEYGNALSGVFDLSMRTGNSFDHEHTLSIGTIGIDLSSEGPIKKDYPASYLFNYRYSSLALVDYIIPEDLGINYQDLAYKIHIPTKKYGIFSLWGLGFIDKQIVKPVDSTEYEYEYQTFGGKNMLKTGVTGLSHKVFLNEDTYLKTVLAGSVNEITANYYSTDNTGKLPASNIFTNYSNITLSTYLNHKFNAAHTNRTGMVAQYIGYNIELQNTEEPGLPLELISKDKGNSYLFQAFTQSSYKFRKVLQVNPGLHVQYFTLSGNTSVEPRLGLKWQYHENQSLSFGYGKHSRLEKINFYLAEVSTNLKSGQLNKKLDFSKAHHFVLGYDLKLGSNSHFKIEPYYQYLYDIPVIEDSSFSFINLSYDWFVNDQLVNKGIGENIGIDLTLERFFNKGWYYLLTTSLFNSKYKGGDGVWRNTRFNRNFVANILIGKEWVVGRNKQNIISLSGRLNYMGGERWTPLDKEASMEEQETVLDHSRIFEDQSPNIYYLHTTITYRRNKKKHSSLWSLQIMNALGSPEYYGYEYNIKTNKIDMDKSTIIIPNLSYKIQF